MLHEAIYAKREKAISMLKAHEKNLAEATVGYINNPDTPRMPPDMEEMFKNMIEFTKIRIHECKDTITECNEKLLQLECNNISLQSVNTLKNNNHDIN